MMRYWKAAAVASFALFAGTASASAQVGISVGGGPSFPIGALGDEFNTGFNVQASAAFTPAALPFGLRVDGAFNRFPEDEGHFRVISGSLNAVFDLPMQGMAPYIIGGVGVYNSQGEHDDGEHEHDAVTNIGANVGAGFRLGVGPLAVFLEGRFHNIFSEGEQVRFIPLTIGVRF